RGPPKFLEHQPNGTQSLARNLPFDPQPEIGVLPAETLERHRDVRGLPQNRSGQAAAVGPYASPGRKNGLRLLPQSAWLDERPDAQLRQLGERALPEMPHRETWPVPLGSRARAGGLQHLPRSPRVQQPVDARFETTHALPTVSYRHASSLDDLRRQSTRCSQQPVDQPRLRQLPCADSRLEQSGGQHLPP